MNFNDWIGAIGVTILLAAYFLQLSGRIKSEGWTYPAMNVLGAGLACIASALIHYLPFVVLEGCWTAVSLGGLVRYVMKRNTSA